jgi:hypothetical protein
MRCYNPFRILFVALPFSFISFVSVSCGHTEAAAPAIPVETVLRAVHDYGKGQASAPQQQDNTLTDLLIPDDPRDPNGAYQTAIAKILTDGDFASLEKEAHSVSANKSRLIGGVWKLTVFFDGVGMPPPSVSQSDEAYKAQIAAIEKWIAAYPDSSTARLALATAYLDYASFARGTGYSNTVSQSGWDLHTNRTRLAEKVLLDAAKLQEKSPYWYEAMQVVALNQGWDKTQARALVEEAGAFEPTYYLYYRRYGNFLLPKWYGEEGETQAYAEEISTGLGGDLGEIVYFEIASVDACQCDPIRNSMEGYSWPKVVRGYAQLKKLYGVSPIKMNRFAFMAYTMHDKSAAKEVFTDLGNNRSSDVWSPGSFQTARDWAATPLP